MITLSVDCVWKIDAILFYWQCDHVVNHQMVVPWVKFPQPFCPILSYFRGCILAVSISYFIVYWIKYWCFVCCLYPIPPVHSPYSLNISFIRGLRVSSKWCLERRTSQSVMSTYRCFYGQCPYMLENEHPSVSRYVHVAIFGSTVRLVTIFLCRRKLLERQSVSHDNENSDVWKDSPFMCCL